MQTYSLPISSWRMENINFNQSHLGLMRALSLCSVATDVTNYDKQILDSWILLLSVSIKIMLVQCHNGFHWIFTFTYEGRACVGQLGRYAWPDTDWTSFGHLKMILGIAEISTNRGGRCRSETDILSGKWNYETELRIPWSEGGKYGSGYPCEIIE